MRYGNSWADDLATRGRQLHDVPADTMAGVVSWRDRIKTHLTWIAKVSLFHGRSGPRPDKVPMDGKVRHRQRVQRRMDRVRAKRARKEALALAKANPILPLKRAGWARAALEGVPLLKRARSGDCPGEVTTFHIPDNECDVGTVVFDMSDPGESLLAVSSIPHGEDAGSSASTAVTAVATASSSEEAGHPSGDLGAAGARGGRLEEETGERPWRSISRLEGFRLKILKRELAIVVAQAGDVERQRTLEYEINLLEHGAPPPKRVRHTPALVDAIVHRDAEVGSVDTAGHVLHTNNGVTWCSKCAGLTTGGSLRLLASDCKPKVLSKGAVERLRRLDAGFHPYMRSVPMGGVTRRIRLGDLAVGVDHKRRRGGGEVRSGGGLVDPCTSSRTVLVVHDNSGE